jgi:hypothetical protein
VTKLFDAGGLLFNLTQILKYVYLKFKICLIIYVSCFPTARVPSCPVLRKSIGEAWILFYGKILKHEYVSISINSYFANSVHLSLPLSVYRSINLIRFLFFFPFSPFLLISFSSYDSFSLLALHFRDSG